MIKPNKLKKGDTIAIISPSGGLASLVPHRIETAVKNLEELGFKVKLYPTLKLNYRGKAGTINERLKDLHDAFYNKEIKAIICSIGGISNNELISKIDYDLIIKNPKIFIGYSDTTLLHYSIQKKTNLVTFYGPCAMTQFGEFPNILKYTKDSFIKTLMNNKIIGKIKSSKEWTDEILNWFEKLDLTRKRKMNINNGYTWLKTGIGTGNIIGGCLSSILQLSGTNFDLDYENKILFIEISEGQDFMVGEPIDFVESQIIDLKNRRIFNKINGLIIGRPYKYSDEDKVLLKEILKEHLEEYNFPILYNVDIGHTDPMMTLPLGVKINLNSKKNLFNIDESGVE